MAETINVFHLEDDPLVRLDLLRQFESLDMPDTRLFYRGFSHAIDLLRAVTAGEPCDCCLIDLMIRGSFASSQSLIESLRRADPELPILVVSQIENPEMTLAIIRDGVSDFISKSREMDTLAVRVVAIVLRARQMRSFVTKLSSRFGGSTMRRVEQTIERLLWSEVRNLMVLGETGVGKELIAEIIRDRLPNGTPFVALNCARLSGDLIESELFGHARGAFTGAVNDREGLFVQANSGWLFLDEVGRLSSRAQANLLRVLETGEVMPLGGSRAVRVEVRVVSATNENLLEAVRVGNFRADLLQRLCGYEINLPPWRHRSLVEREEILDSLMHRMNYSRQKKGREPFELAEVARKILLNHPWENGNIRELWQVLQGGSVNAVGSVISAGALPRSFIQAATGISGDYDIVGQAGAGDVASLGLLSGLHIDDSNLVVSCGDSPTFASLEIELFQQFLLRTLRLHVGEIRSLRTLAAAMGMTRGRLTSWLQDLSQQRTLPVLIQQLLRRCQGEESPAN